MGLVGKSVKYGGIFLAVREGVKALEKHNDNKRAQHAQQIVDAQMTPYAYQQPPSQQQSREVRPEYQSQPSEMSPSPQAPWGVEGSLHQVWCNGRCDGRCGAKEALMALQQSQQGHGYVREKETLPAY